MAARKRRKSTPSSDGTEEPLRRAIYRAVRRIPRGRVTTYGEVAVLAGRPRAARAVGRALATLPGPLTRTVPWHRVVGSSGKISFRDDDWPRRQRELLEREGVRFRPSGRIDLERFGWPKRPRSRFS